ncbi:MAG: hypothetical protein OEZ02_00910 [Anaerolineae bacterium]|nr:hypothetical protein [Anaerolineae bacterium]
MTTDTILQTRDRTSIVVTADSPTLSELRQIKDVWLQAAKESGDLEACLKVGRELGVRGERYPSSSRTPPMRWRKGEVTVHYTHTSTVETSALLNVAVHVNWGHVVVTLGGREGFELLDGRRVCYYTFFEDLSERARQTNHGHVSRGVMNAVEAERAKQFFFVPGEWINLVRDALPQIEARDKSVFRAAQDKERQELIDLLQIGKEI